jgi:hypothetical protein
MPRTLLRLLAALSIVVFAAPSAVQAGHDDGDPSSLCLAGISAAQRHYDTPPGLLAVMAKVESGRAAPTSGALEPWPWTVDADGQGVFFATKAQAVAWSRQALDSGTVTFLDVGCMQVDLRMHPHAFATLDEAFDPTANTDYGARFLRELYDGVAGGNWFTVVGFYHSQTPVLAALYREQVAAVGAGLPPPRMPSGHLSMMRLDLAGGGVLRLNVNHQPARVHRHLTACQIAAILGSYLPRQVAGCGPARRRIAEVSEYK